jgi:hypothetical protein
MNRNLAEDLQGVGGGAERLVNKFGMRVSRFALLGAWPRGGGALRIVERGAALRPSLGPQTRQ